MIRKLFGKLHTFVTETWESSQWRDTRLWAFVVFAIVVVVASWSGVRVIETNYELQKKIARLQQQNEITQLQNENQKLKNQYLETDTYLELAAREQFGKAAPGEKLILVPESVALSNSRDIPMKSPAQSGRGIKVETSPSYIKNLKAWRDFVFSHKLQEVE